MFAGTSPNSPNSGSNSGEGFEGEADIIRAWARGLAPDPSLTVSEWADRYRILSSRASSEAGRYRTDRTPYMRDIMDALSPSHPARRIVFMSGAQLGKTEAGNNWIGYQSGTVAASRIAGYSERKTDVSVPIVMDEIQAQAIADRALAEAWIGRETSKHSLPPDQVALDAGDVINLVIDSRPREFRLTRLNDAWARTMDAQRCEGAVYAPPLPGRSTPAFEAPPVYGRSILEFLDLPMLRDSDIGYAPYVGASATPFAGVTLMDSATGIDYAARRPLYRVQPANVRPIHLEATGALSLNEA